MRKTQPGKNIVLLTAFVLLLIALVLLVVAFCTPYWVISWPRVFNEFRRLGLWEACFNGLVLDWDAEQKAYHGCWWILAEEYIPIRDWLMPPWFVTTQVLVTLCLVAEFVGIALVGMLYSNAKSPNAMGQVGEIRQPYFIVQAATVITIVTALSMTFCIMLFAGCFWWDKNWLPRKDLNYLSFSYGLAVLSAFFSIFGSIALVVYRKLIIKEYRDVPTHSRPMLNLSMTSAKDAALSMTFCIMLFAGCFWWDKNWLPRKDLNYLSFSYGLAVLSAFFSIFGSIALVVYRKLIIKEYRDVPTHSRPMLNLSMTSAKDAGL